TDVPADDPAAASAGLGRPEPRWPVLYLVHGCCDTYDSWIQEADVEVLTRRTDVLVVMPEAGAVGLYTDGWNHGAGGPPAWERWVSIPNRHNSSTRAGPGGVASSAAAADLPGSYPVVTGG